MAMDESKLNEFLGRALVDLGGAVNAVLMSIGDELGLYKALANGPQSPAELARNTNTNERYVREWLNCQAAGGYVTFDKATAKYSLSEEQELCLANPAGPVDLPGATLLVQDMYHVRERALENFRTGRGMEWGEHDPCLFCGTERFFRAGYSAHLLSSWIPALDGNLAVDTCGFASHVEGVGCELPILVLLTHDEVGTSLFSKIPPGHLTYCRGVSRSKRILEN